MQIHNNLAARCMEYGITYAMHPSGSAIEIDLKPGS
jgi:hypothetical protein